MQRLQIREELGFSQFMARRHCPTVALLSRCSCSMLTSLAKIAFATPRDILVPTLKEKTARAPAKTGAKGREHS
eukprot:scaffold293227_cov39-Tisochrysis_lutea.AAC.3